MHTTPHHRPEQAGLADPTDALPGPPKRGRSKGPTITLGICLAAGLAAGIGLMRPGNQSTDADAQSAQQAQPAEEVVAPEAAPGYGAQTGTDPAAPAAAPAPAPAAGAITIADFAFGDPITVAAGSTITVNNVDGATHTLTADDGSFNTGSIAGGGSVPISAPGEAGTYSFFCSIHPSMQGTLTVAS